MIRTIAALFCILMTATLARADSLSPPGGPKHIAMRLIAEGEALPGGQVNLAIDAKPAPGWHGYWSNPGDAGLATIARWNLPAFWKADGLDYPVPDRLLIAGLMNYIYERPFTLLTGVVVPKEATTGALVPIKVHLDYLVCTDSICVPEQQDLATTVRVGSRGSTPVSRTAFDGWRRALPQPLGSVARFTPTTTGLRVAIPYPADAPLADPYLFPRTPNALTYAAPQKITRDGDRLLIETSGKPGDGFDAVLRIGPGRGLALTAKPGAVPGARGWFAAAALAFAGAVLGGLILNVMPCVFPILSLKALSLARSGTSERHARAEALAYTAGVVLVVVALGAVILGLRAGGASIGWAFQLQNSYAVLFLALLSAAIAFDLAGLFELPTPRLGGLAGSGGAFATGALAAVIATPCTGPFMGAALGAALVLPWPAALAVFAGLGLGLALPFLALGFVPALRRRLPKPGAWMEQVRRVLSLPMFLTAIALGWVLGKQAGVDALTFALAMTLLLAAILWAVGLVQRQGRPVWPMLLGGAVVIAIVGWTELPVARPGVTAAVGGDLPFSEAKLAQLRAERKPVFAYFTADWCLTCKVNERVAIEPARAALARKGVAVLVGDWTNGDPALGRFIEAHNRAGVPLYLYYAPGQDARVLPQVLTPGTLTAL